MRTAGIQGEQAQSVGGRSIPAAREGSGRGMQLQLSLALDVAPPAARRTDPATSHAAAASAKQLQAQHHGVIVECLKAHGPLGKDGIAARTHITGVAVARRMSELARLGLVRPTGKTVSSTAGRAETEWECV